MVSMRHPCYSACRERVPCFSALLDSCFAAVLDEILFKANFLEVSGPRPLLGPRQSRDSYQWHWRQTKIDRHW
jgi:hypothetical protein